MAMHKVLFAGMFVCAAFTVARAEDVDEDELDDSRARTAGLGVKTIFPEYHPSAVEITAGKPTKALVKFSNNADTTFNVEFVSAHLAHPEQPANILMNLTGMVVNRTVNQHETVNVEYAFAPVREINPQDYNLVIGVHFVSEDGDSNERDSLTAFNGTVSINDGTSAFDLQGLFLAVLIGGGFFFAYNKFTGGKKTLKVSAAAAPAAARTATSTSPVPEGDIDLSYVDATLHKKATRTRSGSPAKKN